MRKSSNLFLSSSSSPSTEDIVEEREETMVFPSQNSKKSHLLKPCFSTSIDGSSPDVKALSLSVSFHGYRFANRNFKSWARKMSDLHKPTWKKAGIFEAVMASTYKISKNTDLLLILAEKWCHETKTFVFPWGETTVTLEDVMVLLGFSVLGSPFSTPLDSSGLKIQAKLENEWVKIKEDKVQLVTQAVWMMRFMNSDDDELEHVAFLVLWLSYFVLPSRYYNLYQAIFPIAIHLSAGTRIALAPAVLSHLYAELSLLKTHIRDFNESTRSIDKIELISLFKLVQVWTWERFRELQPKPNLLLKGEPRMARWSKLTQSINDVRQVLDNSNSFEWRPYTKAVKNWDFPKYYPEKAMWVPVGPNLDDEFISFARCIKVSQLVGFNCVEHYFPNRVASQFGMIQDVPASVNRRNLSQKEAWKEYDKPIDDFAFYIPCRTAAPRVTPMFCEWRRNLLEDGMKTVAEDSMKRKCMYMKRARDKRRKKVKLPSVPSDNDEEDNSLNVAQILKQNNKESGGDASDPLLGANGGVVEDIVVSPPETRGNCDDELNAYESNADMIDDGRKEPKCLIQEDGVMIGEYQRTDEKLCNEADKENDVEGNDSLIKKKLAVDKQTSKADISESSPCQKLAGEGANGDGTSKVLFKRMILSPSDESNIDIAAKGQDCLLHDDDIEIEQNMKSSGDAGNGSNEKRFEELKVRALLIEERILKAGRNVAWLKERRAIKQRKIAEARFI